jgi:3-oxoacyl-[acyl-carrier-protein] synthase II
MITRRIVITGMGVVVPNGRDLNSLWRAVVHGQSAVRRVSRFSTDDTPSHMAAEVEAFDPTLYMDRKAAKRLDLCHLYAVAAARLAESDAKIQGSEIDRERIGVAFGTSLGGIESVLASQAGLLQRGYRGAGIGAAINGYSGSGAGEIACQLDIRGHGSEIGSGSASGNDAIGYAIDLLRLGDVDAMLAGGSEAPIFPTVWASLCLSRVMTRSNGRPEESMKPFDCRHDGMVLGEGAAFVVLEELSHARRRGANIYCEVQGHARSSEAHHPMAPHPAGVGPRQAIERSLRRAGIDAREIDYINAHGTATGANDAAESRAIRDALGDHVACVSSTKPVTGHLLGAAGAVETVITALAIHHQTAPMTLNFQEAAPGCHLDYVPRESRRRPIRTAINLSCGFGGLNSSLVLRRFDPDRRSSLAAEPAAVGPSDG